MTPIKTMRLPGRAGRGQSAGIDAMNREAAMHDRCHCRQRPGRTLALGCIECGASCCPACAVLLEGASYCAACAAALLEAAPTGAREDAP